MVPARKTPTMNLTFTELLRFHRSRLDISQTQAASLLETPMRTYQSWELGHSAPNKITQLVAVATLENLKTEHFIPTKLNVIAHQIPGKSLF
jgi:DNA-binding transcriptional regulator YiaG